MRFFKTFFCLLLVCSYQAQAAGFETANSAVKNMGVGWNLGNTLDAQDMTKTWKTTADHETCWGQPVTKPELFKMMKEAGFSAMRIPVTWYQEIDQDGKVKEAWMKRVHEVVDYVIENDMYCILNVHHDTGEGNQAWLIADEDTYAKTRARYENLWKQIATEFKDYDQRLLFESYNEMLDSKKSWCYASFNATGQYNEAIAKSAYNAINSYAQSFVDIVRATGGHNAERNLVVNTYGACCGLGTWSSHLKDPIKEMKLPTDKVKDHLIFQIHSYANLVTEKNNQLVDRSFSEIKQEFDNMFEGLVTYLQSKNAPVIAGEWGTEPVNKSKFPDQNDYRDRKPLLLEFVDYYVKKAKEKGIATFYWMGLSDGVYRNYPAFNQPDIAETIVKAYHGSDYHGKYPTLEASDNMIAWEGEKQLGWGDGVTIPGSIFEGQSNTKYVEMTYTINMAGDDIQLCDGNWNEKLIFFIDDKSFYADFNPSTYYKVPLNTELTTALSFDTGTFSTLQQKGLVIHGQGILLKKVAIVTTPSTTGIGDAIKATNTESEKKYNLQGQRIKKAQKGIYIRNGKKYIQR